LNGKIAIAFASSNASEIALDIIAQVQGALKESPSTDIFNRVFGAYKQKLESCDCEKPDCEFLVLTVEENTKRLAHITATEMKFCERAYIGDPAQYQRMTKLRKPYEGPKEQYVQQPDGSFKIEKAIENKGLIEFIEIGFAAQELVQQRRNEGVGAIAGNVIRVSTAWPSGELQYLQTHESSVGPAEGTAGFSLLASNSGIRGIGIYYVAGKIGFLLIVGDSEMCRKEAAESMDVFKQVAKQKYGLDLI
jgi:hypothetical protein